MEQKNSNGKAIIKDLYTNIIDMREDMNREFKAQAQQISKTREELAEFRGEVKTVMKIKSKEIDDLKKRSDVVDIISSIGVVVTNILVTLGLKT